VDVCPIYTMEVIENVKEKLNNNIEARINIEISIDAEIEVEIRTWGVIVIILIV